VTLPLVEELVPAPDPASACAALAGMPYLLFLDSATHAHARDAAARDRYSFLAADPAIVVRCKAGRAERLDYRDGSRTPLEGHGLTEIRRLLEPFAAEPRPDLPPFQGGAAGYIASKAGVIAFAQAVAAEYKNDGIRCNAILPSVIDTPGNRASMPKADFSKWVKPAEIAGVIAHLLSEDSRPTSGAAIPVYGRA